MDFNRCTQRLRKVFQEASAEARRQGCGYIGGEHLLVALLKPQGGMAQAILLKWGIDPAMVYRELIEPIPRQWHFCRPPLTPNVKQALEWADTIATAMGSESVGPEHFLMGLLQVEEISARNLLRREGLTTDWVRAEIIRRATGDSARS